MAPDGTIATERQLEAVVLPRRELPSADDNSGERSILPSALRQLLVVALTAAVLLWPALVNRGPFWHPDTTTYIRGADAAVVKVTGRPSEWSNNLVVGNNAKPGIAPGRTLAAEERSALVPSKIVLTGRSIYYGLLVYLPMRALGPWGAVALQALLVSSLLWVLGALALKTGLLRSRRKFAIGLGICAVASPLPFYTSTLMPDVFSGILVLALTLAIVEWPRLSIKARTALILMAGMSVTFHTTHFLIALIIVAFGIILRPAEESRWRPLLAGLPVVLIGWLAQMAFSFSVQAALHEKPVSPPFLQARLVAAGPGTAFLKADCAEKPDAWAACRYLSKFPLPSDAFLWQNDPRWSVFQALDETGKRRMAAEDKRLALAILQAYPVGVVLITARSSVEQLFSFDYQNYNMTDARLAALPSKYPSNIAKHLYQTRAVQRTMPTAFALFMAIALTITGLVLIAAQLRDSRERTRQDRRIVRFLLLLVLAVLANAAICGGLSGAHARYQMRLVWVLPLVAIAIAPLSRRLAAKPQFS